ncbi:MAG: MMPL family transporter [Rhodothalassiaceae bacterium]
MTGSRFDNLVGAFLARAVAIVHARPGRTLSALLLLLLLSAAAAMTSLGIDTDSSHMIDDREPFRQNALRLDRSFPDQKNQIVLVLRAPTPDDADAAVARLVARLQASPEYFHDVFAPSVHPYFQHQGLLFKSYEDLIGISERLSSAAPILKALIDDPGLAEMFRQLARVERASEQGIGLPVVAAAYDEVAAVIEALLAGTPRALSWQQLFGEGEETVQRVVTAIPVLDYSSLQPARAAIDAARIAIRDLEMDGIRVGLTGDPVLRTEELKSVSNGMELSALLSLTLVALLLAVGLRDWQYLLVSVAALVTSLILTAGFAALTVGELNLVSIAFAVLLMGLGIDFAIHLLLACREWRSRGAGDEKAMIEAVREVGPALTLAAITTSAAFLAFAPTRFVGMAQLGIIAGTGVLIAFAVTLTLLPAALRMLPQPVAPPMRVPRLATMRPNRLAHRSVLFLMLLSGLAAIPFASRIRFDADPMALRDRDAPSVRAFDLLFDRPQDVPYRLYSLAPDLEAAIARADRFEALPGVRSAITLNDFVPDEQADKLIEIDFLAGNLDFLLADGSLLPEGADEMPRSDPDEAKAALAQLIAASANVAEIDAGTARGQAASRLNRALIAFSERADGDPGLYVLLEDLMLRHFPAQMARLRDRLDARAVTIADLPPDLIHRFLADDGTVRIEILPRADVRDRAARAAFVSAVAAIDPGLSGGAYSVMEAGRVVATSMAEASGFALVIGSLLIFLMLRRLRLLILILLPLFLAGLWTIAAGTLLHIPFNFANVIVLPLMIGIGVDSAIHLVMRAETLEGNGQLFSSSTPRAVFLSALTTIATFGTLALSSHRGTASMGIMLAIAIMATLLATLVLLPALLALFNGRKPESGDRP